MQAYKLSVTEKIILGLVLVILIIGYILFYTNLSAFIVYVEEDGTVEWLTVVGLMLGCIVSFSRFFKLLRRRNWWFLTVTFMLGLLLFFASGEEISWGQRILGIKSPEFFQKNNAQHETNIHNLIVDHVKLNKLIFSFMLSIAMGIYLLLIPILFEKSKKIKAFINYSGVPVPRLYQVIAFVALILLTTLLRHEKNAELLECGTGLLFFLIIRYPKNQPVFERNPVGSHHL
ncbi:MAG TPA: hypothetical protein VNS32_03210 [Flavisolibacter sp.]|nr:hypothetical protein [Flavisolibacter sp.]HWJ92173.1 hypothetical protein [Flavisolibacter sp.]